MTEWNRRCILCANRDKVTKLETGHVCAPCQQRVTDGLRDVLRLAEAASAYVTPGSSSGGSGGSYGSRLPISADAVCPELMLIELNAGDPTSAVTILDCLGMWEVSIREDRGLTPYGPASAARADQGTPFLTGVVGFLLAHVDWMVTEPTFGIEEAYDHIRRCVRTLRKFDATIETPGTMVRCPTAYDDGECGYPLHYREADERVTCRRCGASRDVTTLVAVAMTDPREVWIDEEAAVKHFGVPELHLRRWARRGWIRMDHGRYNFTGIQEAQMEAREEAWRKLAKASGH